MSPFLCLPLTRCQMPVMATTPCHRKFWVGNLRLVSLAWSPVCCHTCFLLVLPAPPPPLRWLPAGLGQCPLLPTWLSFCSPSSFCRKLVISTWKLSRSFPYKNFPQRYLGVSFLTWSFVSANASLSIGWRNFVVWFIYYLCLIPSFLFSLSFWNTSPSYIRSLGFICKVTCLFHRTFSLYFCCDFEILSPLFRPLSKILFPFNVFSMLGFKNHDFSCLLVWKRYSCFIDNSPKWKQKTLSEKWVD